MTTYISKGRTIDQLFSNIESGKINRKYVNQRYKQGDAFSLVKGFTTTEQEEILNSINSEFTRIYESITSSGQRINPNKVYLNIKNTFLKGMFLQEDNGIVSNPDLEVAKKHYDLLSQGTKVFNKGKDSNIKVAKKWKLFGSIYKRWNTKLTKDEFENISEEGFGFEYLAKRQLSKWGITVVGDLTTEIEDDVFDERIYNRNYAEESRKDSLSGKVKAFLSKVPELKDGKVVPTILGGNTKKTIPFDQIYEDVAYTIVNSVSFNDMLNKLKISGITKEPLNTVATMLEEEVRKENWQFLADFYKNLSLTYLNFVGAIEEVDIIELEGGGQDITFKIRYFNTNTNKSENRIYKKWNLESRRSDNKGLLVKSEVGTLIVDKVKVDYMQDLLKVISEIKTDKAIPDQKHIQALSDFLNLMSIDISPAVLAQSLESGIKIGTEIINSGELYRYLTDGKSRHSNNNIGLNTLIKNLKKNKDPFLHDRGVIQRFLNISKEFEEAVRGSFINGEGKSIYPINMHTSLTRQFNAFKSFNIEEGSFWNNWVMDFTKDQFYFPEGNKESPYNALFLSEIISGKSRFKSILDIEEFDTYKRKNEATSQNTFDNMSPLLSKLHRLNSFANNGNKREMKIVAPTLADRSKMILMTVPRISYNKKLHQYRDKNIQEILLGYVVQDLKRAQRTYSDLNTKGPKVDALHIHKEEARGLRYSQFEFLNDNEAGKKLLEYALKNSEDQLLYRSNDLTREAQDKDPEIYSLFKNVLTEIEVYINNQVEEQLEDIRKLKIDSQSGRRKTNPIDPNGLAIYNGDLDAFIKDYVVSTLIGQNEFRKMTAGDLALYKNYATFSKRNGGITTPGLEAWLEEFAKGATYGDMTQYEMGAINDLFKKDEALLDELEKIAGKESVKAYKEGNNGKGSNRADGIGFTTIKKHKAKMEGQGTWLDSHDLAYKNYLKTGNFSWKDVEGNTVIPKLDPIKTYHDGLYLKNGRMVRILVKHSTFPLIKEFTKNRPTFDSLREWMEINKVDEVNMDSAIKVGLTDSLEVEIDENGRITNLDDMYVTTLETRNQRIPQIVSNKEKESKIGSQLMKLLPANVIENLDGSYTVGKVQMSGEEVLQKYNEVIEKMIETGRRKLYNDLGYDKYVESNRNKEDKLKFLKSLRQVLRKSAENNDLPDNYIKALNIKPIVEFLENKLTGQFEEADSYGFSTPIGMPAYQKKFESIIFSLFRNNLMRPGINGKALVQIAELGGFREQNGDINDLDFIRNKEGKIIAAEVALPYHLAEKLNLPKGEDGEYDISKVDPNLLEIIGYRIPTQGKNSMLPLKIKRILTSAMGKAILVPSEIATQMGSDYDIDKLFLMFPNFNIKYTTKKGDVWEETGAFKSLMLQQGFKLNNVEASNLLKSKDYAEDILRYGTLDLQGAAIQASMELDRRANYFEVSRKAIKVPYDINNLKVGDRRTLENAFIDLANSILLNSAHLEEVVQSVDSQTLPDLANKIRKANPEKFSEKVDPQNVNTESTLEFRNKTGKTGIGIYATNLTGAAIRQHSNTLELLPSYAVKFDTKIKKKLNTVRDGTNTLITFLFNKHLNLAVDNGKDPMMDIIQDTSLTSPVTNLIISSGISNKRLAIKGTDTTGDSTEVATWFRTQPIIRELNEAYLNEEGNPGNLKFFIEGLGKKYFRGGFKLQDFKNTFPISTKDLKDFILENKDIEDDTDLQKAVLVNFYFYHQAGRMLNKVNKVYNSDRIKDMSSMAAIEDFLQIATEIQDPNRNKFIKGFEDVLDGEKFRISSSFTDALMDSLEFSELFFPYLRYGLRTTKNQIRKDLNKKNLNKDQIQAINNASMVWFYSQKQIPSPISPLFSTSWKKDLLTGDNNIENQYLNIRDLIKKSSKNSELGKLANNKFILSLDTHIDNAKLDENEIIVDMTGKTDTIITPRFEEKILSFDYSFALSPTEVSALSDDLATLIYNENETIRNFGKNLVYYNILSKGFNTGIDSFIDIIPNEVWNDADFSLLEEKTSMTDFYEKNVNQSFSDPNFWKGFSEEFVKNNKHLRNLIPSVRKNTKNGITPNNREITLTKKSSAYSGDLQSFSKFFLLYNNKNQEYLLYQKVRDRGDRATYVKAETKGTPFKLQEYNFQELTGSDVMAINAKTNNPKERIGAIRKNKKCN
jgi:hypothetical protein